MFQFQIEKHSNLFPMKKKFQKSDEQAILIITFIVLKYKRISRFQFKIFKLMHTFQLSQMYYSSADNIIFKMTIYHLGWMLSMLFSFSSLSPRFHFASEKHFFESILRIFPLARIVMIITKIPRHDCCIETLSLRF